jgi:hypothetical protein
MGSKKSQSLSQAHSTLARSMLTVRRRRIGSAALKDHLILLF